MNAKQAIKGFIDFVEQYDCKITYPSGRDAGEEDGALDDLYLVAKCPEMSEGLLEQVRVQGTLTLEEIDVSIDWFEDLKQKASILCRKSNLWSMIERGCDDTLVWLKNYKSQVLSHWKVND